MSKYAGEEVLVVPRALLNEIGAFEGIRTEGLDAAVAKLMDPANHSFMDRAAAEEDPSFKQLIPYCIFRCGDRILHYTRGKSGGESRLHAKISVGVGGHINPVDTGGGRTGPDAYHSAVTREIEEELDLPEQHEHRIIALLNDESNRGGTGAPRHRAFGGLEVRCGIIQRGRAGRSRIHPAGGAERAFVRAFGNLVGILHTASFRSHHFA